MPGWVWFAGVMLFVAGSFQLIHGFAALERKQYFSHQIVYSNLTFWGWVFLIWGTLQIIAGMLSIAGRMLGNYIGVMLAATAMILWFFMIFTTPLAAVAGRDLERPGGVRPDHRRRARVGEVIPPEHGAR